jgi:hypothetical protein
MCLNEIRTRRSYYDKFVTVIPSTCNNEVIMQEAENQPNP